MEPLEQRQLLASFDVPLLNFPGQAADPLNFVNPPDTMGAVGRNHYVQMVNSVSGSDVAIYNKSDGSLAQPPFPLSSLSSSFSTCSVGLGDPVAVYDQAADRWLLSEFAALTNTLCVYISQSSDPTAGTWNQYEFDTQLFPDYPKYSFTGDSYLVTTNEPGTVPVYALDRENMLAGLPARPAQRFNTFPLAGFGFQALTPADVDGPLPPTGSPAYALRHVDDELHSPTNDPFNDFIEIYGLNIDFDTPANSSFSLIQRVPVGEFDSDLCNAGGDLDCVPQPGTNEGLDAIPQLLMHRVQYRNFGTHETMVMNLTYDVNGNDLAGIRWLELRKDPNNPLSQWTLYQEGTQAPPDGRGRFMGSIAMDGNGNIALGYNVSAADTSAKLVYTGRRASDPLGVMTQRELPIVNGSGFIDLGNRFGDYSAMTVDPVNDTTFWFTGEFAADGFWGTQITAFTFGDTVVPPITPPGTGPATISGKVWHDVNNDGEPPIPTDYAGLAEEVGLPGFHVFLDLDDNGVISFGEPAAVTDENGNYTIDIPAVSTTVPTTFIVRPVLEPGWELTTPATDDFIEVTIQGNETVTDINFGYDISLDYGNAPSPYPQATHGIVDGFMLGASFLEDGLGFPNDLFAGGSAIAQVRVQTGGLPRGYVQMWMDLNQNGSWSDAGEQVITNYRAGEGIHNIPFSIPNGITPGDVQVRIRYGYERFISPTAPAQAGEVEDYVAKVLGDTPQANPDAYTLPQGVTGRRLDVLANDFDSSNGGTRIVRVTQPSNGASVSVETGGQAVLFTSPPNFFSPPVLTFTYTIADAAQNESTATVTVNVTATFNNPVAVDDSYTVQTGSSLNPLPVLSNDIPGTSPPIRITSVTDPPNGTAIIDNRGTPDPSDDRIQYTPDPGFGGTDQFFYNIMNAASGIDTAQVTVQVQPGASLDDKVDITFQLTDLNGNDLTQVTVGQQFLLNVSVEDVRANPPISQEGVYAAYLDLLYDAKLVSVVPAANALGFDVTFSSFFGNGRSGNPATPGLIDEFGSFALSQSPLGEGKFLMASIKLTANAVGTATFVGDPADVLPAHDSLLFQPTTPVPIKEIGYGFDDIEIVASPSAGGEGEYDVDRNGVVSPADVLNVINFLNSNGPMALPTFANGGEGEGGRSMESLRALDTNRDSFISAADALGVINHLNGGAGGGEGESGSWYVGSGFDAPVSPTVLDAPPQDVGLQVASLEQPGSSGSELTTLLADNDQTELPRRTALSTSAIGALAVQPSVQRPAESLALAWAREADEPARGALVDAVALDSVLDDLAADVAGAWLDD